MVKVGLVGSSYLAYFYLEYLQPVKVILSGGQILKLLQENICEPMSAYIAIFKSDLINLKF